MSDTPQGPDWWQASDDKWYPPPRPEMPGTADAAAVVAPGAAVPGGPPTGPPLAPPMGPPSGGYPAGPPSGGFPPGAPPSPYGGMPPGAQPPGTQNKTPLYVAIGVVVAAALVGLIVVLAGGDDEPSASTTTTEQTPDTPDDTTASSVTTDTTADPGGGGGGSTAVDGLEASESGFSNTGYGVLITNTSDEDRVNFTVEVAIYDTNDTVVGSDSHSVGRLNAGDTLGIGYDITDEVPNGVGRLDVSFEEGFSAEAPAGTFTVSEVATTSDEYSTETTFTVESTYEVDLESTYAYAIYRNAAGDIIGGTYGFVDLIPAGGRATGSVRSYEPVDGVETTEIYVDQGYF